MVYPESVQDLPNICPTSAESLLIICPVLKSGYHALPSSAALRAASTTPDHDLVIISEGLQNGVAN